MHLSVWGTKWPTRHEMANQPSWLWRLHKHLAFQWENITWMTPFAYKKHILEIPYCWVVLSQELSLKHKRQEVRMRAAKTALIPSLPSHQASFPSLPTWFTSLLVNSISKTNPQSTYFPPMWLSPANSKWPISLAGPFVSLFSFSIRINHNFFFLTFLVQIMWDLQKNINDMMKQSGLDLLSHWK